MADSDPLSQIFTLFAAPLAGAVQSFDQFRSGVDQFQRGVENFNRTMENLNETAERINRLLAEVEEPLRVAVPQFTRSVKVADDMMRVVSGPAMAVAPGLQSLAETLNNPAMRQVPHQLAQMNDVLAEITARLAPLGQFAESAGGIFGLRFPGLSGGSKPEPTTAEAEPEIEPEPEIEQRETLTTRRITIAKQSTSADTGAARENPTRAATAKSAASSATAKSGTKKSASKKTASRKTASRKTASRKTASKKTASKKTASKKTASKKTASEKTADEAT